jgi:4-amino-4-deoxy-L-arabinose transferase-like glycosyltransferase
MRRRTLTLFLIPLIVFLASLPFLSLNLSSPFVDYRDFPNAFWSLAARNNLDFGYRFTRFGAFTYTIDPQNPRPAYVHYPPLLPIILTEISRIFCLCEPVPRLAAIGFTLLSSLLFYYLISQLRGKKAALFSLTFFLFNPMTWYYGQMFSHEAVTLTFILSALVSFLAWKKTGSTSWLILLAVSLALGNLTHWISYFWAATLPLFFIGDLDRRRQRTLLVIIALVSALTLSVYGLHVIILNGVKTSFSDLAAIFKLQVSPSDPLAKFTYFRFFGRELSRIFHLFGPLLVLLSLSQLWKGTTRRLAQTDRVFFQLLFFPALYNLLFSHLAWLHEFSLFFFLPGLSLGAGLALTRFSKKVSTLHRHALLFSLLGFQLVTSLILFRQTFKIYRLSLVQPAIGTWVAGKTPRDAIFLTNAAHFRPQFEYYARRPIRLLTKSQNVPGNSRRNRPLIVAAWHLKGTEGAAVEHRPPVYVNRWVSIYFFESSSAP